MVGRTWLGHPYDVILQKILKHCKISSNIIASSVCIACRLGKSYELPFSLLNSIYSITFGRLTYGVQLLSFHMIVSTISTLSMYSQTLVLVRKFDVVKFFHTFHVLVENQLYCKIKAIQLDNGALIIN